jgi:hypothetical protein
MEPVIVGLLEFFHGGDFLQLEGDWNDGSVFQLELVMGDSDDYWAVHSVSSPYSSPHATIF